MFNFNKVLELKKIMKKICYVAKNNTQITQITFIFILLSSLKS